MNARILIALWFASTLSLAWGNEIVYVPRNPSFGGNPNNGPGLLSSAQLQNKYDKDPDQTSKSALDQFNDTLQSIVLSRLASSISGGLFDPTTGNLVPGSITTSNFTIVITDLGGGRLRITTTDRSTGASTNFEVTQ